MTRIVDAFRTLASLGLICLALTATPAVAGINTWTNASSDLAWNNTSVDWNSPTIWNNANVDDAVFGATGAGTITVSSPITLHGIEFTTAGYKLTGVSPLTLTSGGSGGILGAGEIQMAGGGIAATINAPITGTIGLTKSGAGTLILSNTNSYTGSTTLRGSILQIGDGSSNGFIQSPSVITSTGTTLQFVDLCKGSGCCCADRYFRFTRRATHMHRQCVLMWQLAMDRAVANDRAKSPDRLQLLANERRW